MIEILRQKISSLRETIKYSSLGECSPSNIQNARRILSEGPSEKDVFTAQSGLEAAAASTTSLLDPSQPISPTRHIAIPEEELSDMIKSRAQKTIDLCISSDF